MCVLFFNYFSFITVKTTRLFYWYSFGNVNIIIFKILSTTKSAEFVIRISKSQSDPEGSASERESEGLRSLPLSQSRSADARWLTRPYASAW